MSMKVQDKNASGGSFATGVDLLVDFDVAVASPKLSVDETDPDFAPLPRRQVGRNSDPAPILGH